MAGPIEMNEKSRCSILFHLLVPGGKDSRERRGCSLEILSFDLQLEHLLV